jgi:3-oxoacyl-[acyl-carrier-protein] synthase II
MLLKLPERLRGLIPTDFLDKKEVRRMDRFAQFAVVASQRALQDAQSGDH